MSWTSRIERRFGDDLCKAFPDVAAQVWINDKCVDFYVPSIDTYVQFDGVYWHGLDRPIDIIAEGRTARDVQIYKKWLSDREQDAWFLAQGMRLARFTDAEYKKMGCKIIQKLEVLK